MCEYVYLYFYVCVCLCCVCVCVCVGICVCVWLSDTFDKSTLKSISDVLLMTTVLSHCTDVRKQVQKMIFTIFALIFISAGVIQSIEDLLHGTEMTFMDSIYFIVVTMTTVGGLMAPPLPGTPVGRGTG
mgnify:CR=1 FL=1